MSIRNSVRTRVIEWQIDNCISSGLDHRRDDCRRVSIKCGTVYLVSIFSLLIIVGLDSALLYWLKFLISMELLITNMDDFLQSRISVTSCIILKRNIVNVIVIIVVD